MLTMKYSRKVNIEKLLAKLIFTIAITIILGVSYRSNICSIMLQLDIVYPFHMSKNKRIKTGLVNSTKPWTAKNKIGHNVWFGGSLRPFNHILKSETCYYLSQLRFELTKLWEKNLKNWIALKTIGDQPPAKSASPLSEYITVHPSIWPQGRKEWKQLKFFFLEKITIPS